MMRSVWLSVGVIAFASAAAAQSAITGVVIPPLSPRNASYSIDARLDVPSRTITGSELVTWRNITAKPASELQFHLYWNAWKNARTTFMRERALVGGPGQPRPDDWSRIDVTSIKLVAPSAAGVGDLTASKRFIQPDDGNAEDETVMTVPLPRAVPPGAAVALEVKWSAHVPRTFARTGAIGNYFFIAQWFPKLGVWQDEGWNCHQFHAGTEFFSDYGVYDVLLTVPQGWTVGATGVERDRRKNADKTETYRYYQEDVHDFAWTTSPDYRRADGALRGARAAAGIDAAAASARARRSGRAALRRDAHDAEVLRHLVRSVPVRAHHHRRSRIRKRHRRDGVPDALHSGYALARAGARDVAGGGDGARGRPSILVRHRRQQRVRGRVDGRRVQHVLNGTRDRAGFRAKFLFAPLFRWLHPVGVQGPSDLAGKPTTTAYRAIATRRNRTRSPRRRSATFRRAAARLPTTRPRSG